MFGVKMKIKKQSVFLSGQESWGSVYMPRSSGAWPLRLIT